MKKSLWSASLLALACTALPALSPAVTWDGGGTNSNWSTANNWNPNGAPAAGSQLLFPPAALKLTNVNDFPDLTNFQSLQLSAANYNLGGNDIQLSNGILASHAGGTNTLTLGVQLTQNQSFTVQNDGAFLKVDGDIDLKTFTLTVGGEGNLISNGKILGSGQIIKNGPGFLRLTGDNSFAGGITVNGGSLQVDNSAGSGTGGGAVVVESGAELQGDGAIQDEVLIKAGGKVSPGDSEPALLAVGNLILSPGSAYVAQLNGQIPDTEYSVLQVNGTVALDQSVLRIALGPNVQIGDDFKIIDNDSTDPVGGVFEGLSEGKTFHLVGFDNIGFKISYQGGDGNDVVLHSIPTLTVNDVTVREPSTGAATAAFVVQLNEASSETVTVKYATAPGSALAGDDYEVANGTLTFNPGVTKQTVNVTIDSDDVAEGNEEFSFKIFSPSNATVIKDFGTGTITPPTDGGSGGNGNNGGGSGGGSSNPPGNAASDGGCSLHPGAASTGNLFFGFGLMGLLGVALRFAKRS
ncbi:MAG: Calx-beta domain-containing protein [bacterium]